MSQPNVGKPVIKPIKSNHCLDRLTIDLMDFRGNSDGEYKWILQMKDNFSRFVWVYPLKNKEAASVEAVLSTWFKLNGYPLKV